MNLPSFIRRHFNSYTFDPSSFGILTSNNENLSRLQFNYWAYKTDSGMHYLDIGMEFKTQVNAVNVGVFVPFEIQSNEISSIASRLNDAQICSSIFNEPCSLTSDANDTTSQIARLTESGQSKRIIHLPNAAFKTEKLGDGTLIRFTVNKYDDTEHSRYIRIRLSSANTAKYITTTKTPLGSLFQSIRTQDREIDFRVNSTRSLDSSISTIQGLTLAKFEMAHFFLLVNSTESLLFHNGKASSNRYLEIRAWKNYLPEALKKQQSIFAYHWKGEPNKNEMAIFARTNYASSKIGWMILYLFLTITIAFSINLCSSYAYDRMKGCVKLSPRDSINTSKHEKSPKLNSERP